MGPKPRQLRLRPLWYLFRFKIEIWQAVKPTPGRLQLLPVAQENQFRHPDHGVRFFALAPPTVGSDKRGVIGIWRAASTRQKATFRKEVAVGLMILLSLISLRTALDSDVALPPSHKASFGRFCPCGTSCR